MKKAAIMTLALAAMSLPAQAQRVDHAQTVSFQGQWMATANHTPPASFQGQWFTTANGCSYSRAGVGWFLIMNPHHIGQPNAHAGCASVL